MFIEQDAHPDEPQQDQPHDEAGHHAGKIDPDVCYLTAAPRHEQLDGLIGQRREQAAQDRPRDMLEHMFGVDPQAEHEQEALQQIFREVRQLADDVHREMVCRAGHAQLAQDLLHEVQHPSAGSLGDSRHLHRVREDEDDAADERKGEDDPPGDEPGRGAI